MRKGMLAVFWGLMLLTLTMIELPWEPFRWGMNIAGYGLCAGGMLAAYRRCAVRSFLIAGLGLAGAMICCVLSFTAGMPDRYAGVIQLLCRMMELFGFAKMFEGCWKEFRRRRMRDKAMETDLRMKSFVFAFALCSLAEAAFWFIGLEWGTLLSQLAIRLIYGALMASVMLYSEWDRQIPSA